MKIFKNLYHYRELLKTSVQKDVRGKYKNSFLGVLWSFLNPLLQIGVYAFVFGTILNVSEENYAVFICCGLIPWTFFSTSISRSSFPREILPVSVVTSEMVNFVISSLIIVAFVLVSGLGVHWTWLFYPMILFVLYLFLIGISFLVSSFTVYFRDMQHFIGVILQLLFYATPIAYAAGRGPEKFSWVIKFNPVAYIIEGFRDIFIYHSIPDIQGLLLLGIISLFLCVVGYFIFNKLQKGFAEEL